MKWLTFVSPIDGIGKQSATVLMTVPITCDITCGFCYPTMFAKTVPTMTSPLLLYSCILVAPLHALINACMSWTSTMPCKVSQIKVFHFITITTKVKCFWFWKKSIIAIKIRFLSENIYYFKNIFSLQHTDTYITPNTWDLWYAIWHSQTWRPIVLGQLCMNWVCY